MTGNRSILQGEREGAPETLYLTSLARCLVLGSCSELPCFFLTFFWITGPLFYMQGNDLGEGKPPPPGSHTAKEWQHPVLEPEVCLTPGHVLPPHRALPPIPSLLSPTLVPPCQSEDRPPLCGPSVTNSPGFRPLPSPVWLFPHLPSWMLSD